MRLEKIKLAGFKSFVEPTSIPLPSNLVGIVGPNGCGKSNIIDAVRWVMGESSAKHLRGAHMADVIFNGAESRKPVSVATVELVFDNSDQRVGGEYAQYNQLSIKRQVTREGQSTYFLNNARCRRKDVTDIFLGTGLGPRSYAIIEQGTISRLIEAKPDELRVFIEEAAGISRYKERRRETELRMRNTQENLDRLNDLTDEVGQQLRHLERQVKKAEQYTLCKQQQRDCQQQLLAMRWQRYDQALAGEDVEIDSLDGDLKDWLAELHKTEDSGREARQQLTAQQQSASSTQEQSYHLKAEIARIEQIVKHNQDSQQALEDDHARMIMTREQATDHLQQDRSQLQQLAEQLQATQVALQQAETLADEIQQQADDLDAETDAWQQQWDQFQGQFAQRREQTEVQRARIQQLNTQQQQTRQTVQRLESEQAELSTSELQQAITLLQQTVDSLEAQSQVLQDETQQLDVQTQQQKQQIKQFRQQLDQLRSQEQTTQGKIASLELLQKHAMGKDKTDLMAWLNQLGLQEATRLAEHLQVDSGWEIAVETVLDAHLQAICIEDDQTVVEPLAELEKETVAVFDTTATALASETINTERLLLSKVRAPWSLTPLLATIYCAEDLSAALQIRSKLMAYESVITADGLWLGPGWVLHRRASSETSGVLERGQALRELKTQQQQLETEVDLCQQQQEQAEAGLAEAESRQHQLRQQNQHLNHELTTQNSVLSSQLAHLQQTEKRLKQLQTELEAVYQQQAKQEQGLNEAIDLRDHAEQQLPELEQQKQDLQETQQYLKLRSDEITHSLSEARQHVQQLNADLQTLTASRGLTEQNLQRVELQHQEASARIEVITTQLDQLTSPGDDEAARLEPLRQSCHQQQLQLSEVQAQINAQEQTIQLLLQRQSELESNIETVRSQLETMRMERQANRVHRQTLEEQLEPFEITPIDALQLLPEAATEAEWETELESLEKKIQRLGAVNLLAVEEYKTQHERHQLLQEQQADLTESLSLLTSAIAKIDKESQVLFKDTFERVNEGLSSRFPKLFAGGQAYLQLEGQDLLESGVRIMARPPGKRNSSIHLLSGGEKALTAIALVFSIFDLNPAPFCILDEVDAPLDDANVVRFCQLVEEMSATIQFIYITHNKVTMEISKHLAGVTQKELGVSRMVSVDIDEAIELAAV